MKRVFQILSIVIPILFSAILGSWPALYNKFPLLNPDSGANIMLSYEVITPQDRSVFYTYFIRITNLETTLFSTVFVQSLIGAILIFWFLRNYFVPFQASIITFFAVLVLSLCTPYAWYVSQINPDIFMGYYFLGLLLLFNNNLDNWEKSLLILILLVAISFHNSILIMSLCIGLGYGIAYIIKKTKLIRNKAILILGITLFVFLPTCIVNYKAFQTFTPNPSSHIFLTSRLAEMGILEQVLHNVCPTKSYQLCNSFRNFKGRQWDFMWADQYPHGNNKWLEENVKDEYNALIQTTFTTPKYAFLYLKENIIDALNLLPTTKVDDGLQVFYDGTSPWNNIRAYLPSQFERFTWAKQQHNRLDFNEINKMVQYCFYILIIILSSIFLYKKKGFKWNNWEYIFYALVYCFFNNIITCALSTNLERFNARLIWILPLALIFQIIKNKFFKKNNINA